MSKKTDNSNLEAKVALRIHMLDKYLSGSCFTVIDCCSGQRAVWGKLRKKYNCKYWGIDTKKIDGTMKANSVSVLRAGATANVIDIDTYGAPWAHWVALLPNVVSPTIVFLTIGMRAGLYSLPYIAIRNTNEVLCNVPSLFMTRFAQEVTNANLNMVSSHGLAIEYGAISNSKNASYLGLRIGLL